MEFVFDFVKNIVAITIILNMVECLVSSSEYCKYIRLFTGILIIIGILSMLLDGGKKYNYIKGIAINDKNQKVVSVYKGYEKKLNKRLEYVQKNIVDEYEKSIDKDLSMLGIELKNIRVKENKRLDEVEEINIKIKIDEGGKKRENKENATRENKNIKNTEELDKNKKDKEIVYKEKVYAVISKYYILDFKQLKVDIVN